MKKKQKTNEDAYQGVAFPIAIVVLFIFLVVTRSEMNKLEEENDFLDGAIRHLENELEQCNEEPIVENDCDLKLEQQVSCYKGCQFTTQPTYGVTRQLNQNIRISQYEVCTLLCEDFYDWDGCKK